ncbi:MAG: AbrB/MazE/SpoVT family DNA-binding domain-containing protein [Candidatus Limnocylindria bacterium]
MTVVAITSAQCTRLRARLTSQGQITVPKPVRDAMGLEAGDDVEFELGPKVVVRRHRPPNILSFAGIAGPASANIPRTAEELDALIGDIRRGRRRPA